MPRGAPSPGKAPHQGRPEWKLGRCGEVGRRSCRNATHLFGNATSPIRPRQQKNAAATPLSESRRRVCPVQTRHWSRVERIKPPRGISSALRRRLGRSLGCRSGRGLGRSLGSGGGCRLGRSLGRRGRRGRGLGRSLGRRGRRGRGLGRSLGRRGRRGRRLGRSLRRRGGLGRSLRGRGGLGRSLGRRGGLRRSLRGRSGLRRSLRGRGGLRRGLGRGRGLRGSLRGRSDFRRSLSRWGNLRRGLGRRQGLVMAQSRYAQGNNKYRIGHRDVLLRVTYMVDVSIESVSRLSPEGSAWPMFSQRPFASTTARVGGLSARTIRSADKPCPQPQRGLVSRWPSGGGGRPGKVILADPDAPPQGWPCYVIGRDGHVIQ